MEISWQQFVSLDLPPILAATFAAVSCGLLGNYLVLRRMSLMGDAISHAVLPGIVGVFLIFGTRGSLMVFVGAALAGVTMAVLVETVRRLGRVERGASMGVVFSIFFALGVLLMEQAAARNVDLDADCLLHGQLESIFWYPPNEFSLSLLTNLPSEVWASFLMLLISILFITIFYKELKLSSFDPLLSTSLGFNSRLMHYLLMICIAGAVVASFKIVGVILVIAMIICPGATARMYTDKLLSQLMISAIVAILSVMVGYMLGAFAPQMLGFSNAVSASGMMVVTAGILLAISVFLAPLHGIIARRTRRRRLAIDVCKEDMIASIYRAEELGVAKGLLLPSLRTAFSGQSVFQHSYDGALGDGLIENRNQSIYLTELGRKKAKTLIKTHRLWETYLVESAGLREDHVHETATELEHFTSDEQRERLDKAQEYPDKDPHGKPIPRNKKD